MQARQAAHMARGRNRGPTDSREGVFYFRAFSHCVTPVKVSLAALDSTFPPPAFPVARSTTAPRSAAGVVTGRAPIGQRAGEAR